MHESQTNKRGITGKPGWKAVWKQNVFFFLDETLQCVQKILNIQADPPRMATIGLMYIL